MKSTTLETSGAACALHHRADAFAIRLQLLQMKTSKMANSSWHRATQRVTMYSEAEQLVEDSEFIWY